MRGALTPVGFIDVLGGAARESRERPILKGKPRAATTRGTGRAVSCHARSGRFNGASGAPETGRSRMQLPTAGATSNAGIDAAGIIRGTAKLTMTSELIPLASNELLGFVGYRYPAHLGLSSLILSFNTPDAAW